MVLWPRSSMMHWHAQPQPLFESKRLQVWDSSRLPAPSCSRLRGCRAPLRDQQLLHAQTRPAPRLRPLQRPIPSRVRLLCSTVPPRDPAELPCASSTLRCLYRVKPRDPVHSSYPVQIVLSGVLLRLRDDTMRMLHSRPPEIRPCQTRTIRRKLRICDPFICGLHQLTHCVAPRLRLGIPVECGAAHH